jgi:limonene-1,2-epoxide hydrolase
MASEAENIVNELCTAISRKNLDELLTYFTDDAVYHNIMMEPSKGKAAIRSAIGAFTETSESVQFKVLASASAGNIVMNERVDTLVLKTGKKADVPVAGVFEVKGGKISAWRDYFDMQMAAKQME